MLLFKGYIAIFLYGICTLAQLGSVTIFSQPAFTRQRDCVKLCFVCTTSCPTVWGAVGCVDALIDACVCRNDLWSIASDFFTSCISTRCGNTVTNDLASALSLYNGYCHVDGATLQNDPLPPSTTVGVAAKSTTQAASPAPMTTGSTVTSTLISFATSNPQGTSIPQGTSTSTSAKPETPGQSNVGAIVGGVVAGAVVIGIVAIIITMLIVRERRRRRLEQRLAPQPAMQTPQKPFSPPVVVAATANTGAVLVDRAEGGWAGEQELDGRAGLGPELEGRGGHGPRWNVLEMDGTSRS